SSSIYTLDPFQRSLMTWGTQLVALPALAIATGLAQRFLVENPARVMVLAAGIGLATVPLQFFILLHPPLWLYITVTILNVVPVLLLLPITSVVRLQAIPARYRGVGLQVATPFLLIANWLAPAIAQVGLKIGLLQSIIVFIPFTLVAALLNLGAATSI